VSIRGRGASVTPVAAAAAASASTSWAQADRPAQEKSETKTHIVKTTPPSAARVEYLVRRQGYGHEDTHKK